MARSQLTELKRFFDVCYLSKPGTLICEVGVVTTPPDKDPEKVDNIKVWIHGMVDDNGNMVESPWVRPLSLGFGQECGIFAPPHLNDEVIVVAWQGNPQILYYITKNSLDSRPPPEHVEDGSKPQERWMWKTLRGHFLKLFDDPQKQRIELLSIGGAYFIINDNLQTVEIFGHDGRMFVMDSLKKTNYIADTSGNLFKMRNGESKDITIKHGVSDSFLWFLQNGDVHLHAQEKLLLTAKKLHEYPTEDWSWKIPPTTHECLTDGVDYKDCEPHTRTSECHDCITGEPTNEIPPGTDTQQQYEYKQTTPESTWTVAHNKGKIPQIVVLDEDGYVVDATIKHINKNTAQILFVSPQTGSAYCD